MVTLHAVVVSQRANYWYKLNCWLVAENDLIAIENLPLGFMNRSGYLSLSVHDAEIGLLGQMLEYKAESAGIQVIAVNPSDTPHACSGCGAMVPKGLSVRAHAGPDCGLVLDRDANAAQNILMKALSNPPGRERPGGNVSRWGECRLRSRRLLATGHVTGCPAGKAALDFGWLALKTRGLFN